tara:strand:+ start:9916 stop:10272 length:357 start_codon:yes stop_codon:yes gene_type:complete
MIPNQGQLLAKAAARAAAELQLSTAQYIAALGDDATDLNGISAADSGSPMDPQSQAGKRALQLIEIYQLLQSQTGNNRKAMAHWMTTENRRLGSHPIALVTTTAGLDQITAYLESLTP